MELEYGGVPSTTIIGSSFLIRAAALASSVIHWANRVSECLVASSSALVVWWEKVEKVVNPGEEDEWWR
jgi:hypothetical protein